MNDKKRSIRKVIRETVSVTFWFHALYLTNLHYLSGLRIGSFSTWTYNAALIAFIVYYSLFSKRGWWSVGFDLGYVYFWPFIVTIKLIWAVSKIVYRSIKSNTVIQSPALIGIEPVSSVLADKTDTTKILSKKTNKSDTISQLFRPLSQFAVLWAILSLTATYRPLIMLAIGITLFGAAKALYQLWDFLSDTSDFIGKVKNGFSFVIGQHISSVKGWEQREITEAIKNSANVLKLYESVFQFLVTNRDFLSRWTTGIAVLISVPFYFYISFLFSCVYFGVGRLQGLSWPWHSALIDSLYIPFAFSNLPNNFLIQLIAGLHAIAIGLMGWNIFSRHLGNRLEKISTAAAEFQLQLADSSLKAKLVLIETSVPRSSGSQATDAINKSN